MYENKWNVMFYIGEMFFEVQARIFCDQTLWSIFVSWLFPEIRLARMLIHVCKTLNCYAFFKMLLSMWLVNFKHSCDQVTFRMAHSKITKQWWKSLSSKYSFLLVVLNKIFKWKHNIIVSSYHSKVISTQDKGVLFFSCLVHGD